MLRSSRYFQPQITNHKKKIIVVLAILLKHLTKYRTTIVDDALHE
jgi:hypothetical protein